MTGLALSRQLLLSQPPCPPPLPRAGLAAGPVGLALPRCSSTGRPGAGRSADGFISDREPLPSCPLPAGSFRRPRTASATRGGRCSHVVSSPHAAHAPGRGRPASGPAPAPTDASDPYGLKRCGFPQPDVRAQTGVLNVHRKAAPCTR